MLKLNLVSKKLREEIKLRRIYEMLKHFNYVLILVTFLIAIIISGAKIIMQNRFNKTVEETTKIVAGTQGRNSQIRQINETISYISEIQKDFVRWSLLLKEIGEESDNIVFDSIDINENNLTLAGRAGSRQDLIVLKNSLEKKSFVREFDFPISNILQKENINFEIKIKFDIKEIKNL